MCVCALQWRYFTSDYQQFTGFKSCFKCSWIIFIITFPIWLWKPLFNYFVIYMFIQILNYLNLISFRAPPLIFAMLDCVRFNHCLKSIRVRSFAGPYFPAFGLNNERYSVIISWLCYFFISLYISKVESYSTPTTLFYHCVKGVRVRCFSGLHFLHSDWIRRDTPYLSLFSPNAGKYGPENFRTPTLFTPQ